MPSPTIHESMIHDPCSSSSLQHHGAYHHNGRCLPQAGNKSALSYRADKGIPGYTGYIPSTKTLPLDPKGCCLHTGKLVGDADKTRALLEGGEGAAASE
jgi:hypothetical protein